MNTIQEQLAALKTEPLGLRVAIANPDQSSVEMVAELTETGLLKPIFVGQRAIIELLLEQNSFCHDCEIVESEQVELAVCSLYLKRQADLIMKGNVHTDDLLRAVIRSGLTIKERRISHLYMFSFPDREPIFITDPSINIEPDLKIKAGLIENAVEALHILGYAQPRIAVLSSIEFVNSDLPSSVAAKELAEQFANRNDCLVAGPLALDTAVSPTAAQKKQLTDGVAGRADVLLVPNLDAGNILSKGLVYLAQAEAAGLLVGVKCPIVFSSRSASATERMQTLLLTCLYWKRINM